MLPYSFSATCADDLTFDFMDVSCARIDDTTCARAQVNDAIDKILESGSTTCLFVAHRLSTIARAERIVVLEGESVSFLLSILC